MAVWVIGDLHLAFGAPEKTMDFFGEPWIDYTKKIEENWRSSIAEDDLVLIPGDISWAISPEQAKKDLEWIHSLPGTKVMIRGNHDYWWTSLSKVQKILPPSLNLIQNNAFHWKGIGIAGSRLWDSSEYEFSPYIEYRPNPKAKKLETGLNHTSEDEKIFERELMRLEMSLKALSKDCQRRFAMTHYPPISADLKESKVSQLLEKYNVSECVFGHLHNVSKSRPLFGKRSEIIYHLTSADYLNFSPKMIFEDKP